MGPRLPLEVSPVATPPNAGVFRGLNLFNNGSPLPYGGGGLRAAVNFTEIAGATRRPRPAPAARLLTQAKVFSVGSIPSPNQLPPPKSENSKDGLGAVRVQDRRRSLFGGK
ncbi:uncharacterized protein LOC144166946 [Haemaphysalis longicornis]